MAAIKPNHPTTQPVALAFDNARAFMQWTTDGQCTNPENIGRINEITNKNGGPEWYGLPGHVNAKGIESLVNDGWTDGANKAQRNADSVHVAPARSTKRRRVRGDYGDSLDVDRLYSGQLDTAWIRTARASSVQPPRIRIATNMATPGIADAETLFWRGAASLALASRLITAGYTVQLVTAFVGTYRPTNGFPESRFSITVTAKDFRAPMDVATLAATTALAGFFRAHGFLALLKSAPHPLAYGLGTPATLKESDLPPLPNTRTFIINDGQCGTREGASKWIASTIAEIEQSQQLAA